MRDIKFRLWNDEDNRMERVTEMRKFLSIQWECDTVDDDTSETSEWCTPKTIMQFTGLKDKNGIEIYEGDLIKNQRGRTVEVVWHKFTASFGSVFVGDDGSAPIGQDKSYGFHNADWKHEIEVIGNIYQNQEFIENNNK